MWIQKLLARWFTKKTPDYNQLQTLKKRMDNLESDLSDVQNLLLETIDMTGGPGWTRTMQNAMEHLDTKIELHKQLLVRHQKSLEAISEDEENEADFETAMIIEVKNNLN